MNGFKYVNTLLFIGILLMLSGCVRQGFMSYSDFDRSVNFSQYTTFTLADSPPERDDDLMHNSIIQKQIVQYVADELREKVTRKWKQEANF
jgi:hypothetical protein